MEKKELICITCKNRKHDLKRGICCKLTDEKAQPMESCESYINDAEAVKRTNENKRYTKNDVLPGSVWFKVFALAWGITFLYNLLFGGLFALASSSAFAIDVVVFNLVAALVFGGFFLYTWWLTARKGYRLCYNIGALVVLLFAVNESVRLFAIPGFDIIALSWALGWLGVYCFALIFGLKLHKVNFVEKDHTKFDNKFQKYSYIALSIVTIALLVFILVSMFLE